MLVYISHLRQEMESRNIQLPPYVDAEIIDEVLQFDTTFCI